MIVLECFPIGKEKPALRAWKKKRIISQRPLPCSQGSPSETHTKPCTCSRPRRHTRAVCFIPQPAPFRRPRAPFPPKLTKNPRPGPHEKSATQSRRIRDLTPC